MATAAEIREQTASEIHGRNRLAVPTCAGGVLYLLSAIIIANTVKGLPSVGLLEGIAPAVKGVAQPQVSPRAPEIKFASHHAFGLIAGSTLAGAAIAILTLALLLLCNATMFRRPTTWKATPLLVRYGGFSLAFVTIAHQIVNAIETHKFAVGHVFTISAVEHAEKTNPPTEVFLFLALFSWLAFAAGMITLLINTARVGLLPRWLAYLGIVTVLLLYLPIGGPEFQLVPAIWMVMLGILYIGRWPSGDPPAWAAGEARPWPTAASRRLAAQAAGGPAVDGPAPAPVPAPQQGTSRKRRKRS